MKKLTRLAAILASTAILFSAISCKTDDSGGGGEESGSSIEKNADGTTTLKIEENGKGFVSTTGSINTTEAKWIGYSGGFVENLTIGTSVIYAVKVDSDISDAKIAIHYANWQNTNVRGAYVYVNGTLVNENNPISIEWVP